MRILKGTLPYFYGHLGALLVFNVCTKPRILTCEVNNVPICLPYIYQDSTILRLAWPSWKTLNKWLHQQILAVNMNFQGLITDKAMCRY